MNENFRLKWDRLFQFLMTKLSYYLCSNGAIAQQSIIFFARLQEPFPFFKIYLNMRD